MTLLKEDALELTKKLVRGLSDIFDASLDSIILYGSVARGTETEESDIDIAVIVRACTDEMHDRMIDLIVDLELEYNKVISAILIDYTRFKDWENVMPFYKNIKNEGIVLWKAA